jgi:hypothetical protein
MTVKSFTAQANDADRGMLIGNGKVNFRFENKNILRRQNGGRDCKLFHTCKLQSYHKIMRSHLAYGATAYIYIVRSLWSISAYEKGQVEAKHSFAMTLSITTFSLTTLSIATLSITMNKLGQSAQ